MTELPPRIRPDGRAAPAGPLAHAPEDKIIFVATGHAVPVMPATVSLRPDIVMMPLLDVDPSQVVLLARADNSNPLLTTFRRFAQSRVRDRERLIGRP